MTKQTATATAAPIQADEVIPPSGHTTDLEPANSTGLALIADDPWSDVEDGDLSPEEGGGLVPLIGQDMRRGGGYTLPGGEKTLTVEAVLMAKSKTRAAFRKPFEKSQPPFCRSNDGVVPDPRSPELQSESCATCPLSAWDGDTPPACSEAMDVMVFLPDPHGYGQLARMRFSGLGLSPARKYWSSFGLRMPKRPPIAYVTRITLEERVTDNGEFLVPRFERVTELTREEAQPIIAERARRQAEWQEAVQADVASGAGHAPQDGDGPGPFDGPTVDVRGEAERPFDDTDRTLKVEPTGGGIFDDPRGTEF